MTLTIENYREQLIRKLKTLNETVWERRATAGQITEWLENFEPDPSVGLGEQLHALFLLRHFMYFGESQIRALLRALYRDLYRYPIVEHIRKENNNTKDSLFIWSEFNKYLKATRFVGLGNPAESGPHLLYYFRQENDLVPELFFTSEQLTALHDSPEITRLIFIDDLCGSGDQAKSYSTDLIADLKTNHPDIHVCYYLLFATSVGLKNIKNQIPFDDVNCVVELDETFKCFSPSSRYFYPRPSSIDATFSESMCRKYGQRLYPHDPLGGGDAQLMLGFKHNTPDNSLPIFWSNGAAGESWVPIFRRYQK
jgi:hypothetical protein